MIKYIASATLLGLVIVGSSIYTNQTYKNDGILNRYKDCSYVELNNQKRALGPEDSAFYDEDTLISSYGNIYEIFFQKKDLKTVEKGGFIAIQGIKSGNIKAYAMEIRNYPHNVFLIPLGIYIRGDRLYAINHSFYSGGGDRVEIFKIKKVDVNNQEDQNSQNSQNESASNYLFVLEFISYTLLPERFNGITNDLVVVEDNRFFITDSFPHNLPMKGKNHESLYHQLVTYGYYGLKIKNNHVWDCSIVYDGDANCKAFENTKSVLNNGIATDSQGNFLVADTILKTVRVYQLDNQQELQLKQTLELDLHVDNINYLPGSNSFLAAGTTKMTDALFLPFNINKIENNVGQTPAVKFGNAISEIVFNPQTNKYESHVIMNSDDIIVGASGSQINSDRKYLFVNSFVDKSLALCKQI